MLFTLLKFDLKAPAKLQGEKSSLAAKSNLRSPSKHRSRRTGVSHSRHPAGMQLGPKPPRPYSVSSDDSDDDGEHAPLMSKEQGTVQRRGSAKKPALLKDSRPLSGSAGNVSRPVEVSIASAPVSGSQSSVTSPIGSSTSSLDSPLDTTDNEVYKTVIPKGDSSRRENSLAEMLNRTLTAPTVEAAAATKSENLADNERENQK